MNVKIYRFDPSRDLEGYFDECDIPVTSTDRWTIMDVLDYIALNCDSSLSYFKHSACNHGVCGRCGVRVNGKVKLACTYTITEDKLVLEPKSSGIIKDLVTK